MQLETIGKRVFAFGLTWIVKRDGVAEDIEATLGGSTDIRESIIYQIAIDHPRKGKAAKGDDRAAALTQDEGVVGFFVADKKYKGVCSAAAALTLLGRDGLYVVALAEDAFWYCGIRGGVVVPSTDLIGPPDSIRANVMAMSGGLDLPVYASPGVDIPGSEPFDLGKALSKTKAKPLRLLSSGSRRIVPVLVIAAVAGLGFFGYRRAFPPQPKLSPAQQQAILRQSYVTSVAGVVHALPMSATWVLTAYSRAIRTLPPFVAGWTLEGVTCTPSVCHGMYAVTKDSPFALSPLVARFGTSIKVLQDRRSAEVTSTMNTPTYPITEPFLRSLQSSDVPLLDWIGAIPFVMGGASLSSQVLDNNLGMRFGAAAAGMPSLIMEQASVKGEFYLDGVGLAGIVSAGTRGGFVPIQFSWSFGDGRVPATWRMTWMRIHE